MYGFSLIFSLLSLIFIYEKIPNWVQFLISFVFIAPIFYFSFMQGKSSGEKMFKSRAKTTLADIHSGRGINIPYYKCVFHVIGFVVPLYVIFILSVILKNTVLRLVAMIFAFPAALMFSSINVLSLSNVTPITLAIFLPYVLLEAGMFVLGYFLKSYALKRQHGNIENEIRAFDN